MKADLFVNSLQIDPFENNAQDWAGLGTVPGLNRYIGGGGSGAWDGGYRILILTGG